LNEQGKKLFEKLVSGDFSERKVRLVLEESFKKESNTQS